MFKWLFSHIESFVQTVVTERILLFHEAMIRRDQIKPIRPGADAPRTNP